MTSTLSSQLSARQRTTQCDTWQPELLRIPRDRDRIQALLEDPALRVHDEIRTQVRGLLGTRAPAQSFEETAVDAHLGDPGAYGVWVWYPWSDRLVHVLPEDEFRELRTSRNRHKISSAEQVQLRALTIGIVGMSIGSAAAVTLAMEEVGGRFLLADFDFLELSNMNRLRAGVAGLGVPKAVLAAREMFEINPYLDIELFLEGVHAHTLDAFLQPDGRPLDLVFEECDDLRTKFEVRERARALRIPVLMETSDRGMMDIERFDLEPDRPLFHGLVGDVDVSELDLTEKREKVPLMLRIMGPAVMSPLMKASMLDVDTTLASWPQLASEVSLGAAINVDSARRIALGKLQISGRFQVDLQSLISAPAPSQEPWTAPEARVLPQCLELPTLIPGPLDRERVRTLASWMTSAFSGGNAQPWSLVHRGSQLGLHHDLGRSGTFLDVDHRASYLAFGSMLEIARQVAPALGLSVQIETFPTPGDLTHIATLELSVSPGLPIDPLVKGIPGRVANRQLGPRAPLPEGLLDALRIEAGHSRLDAVTVPGDLSVLAELIGRCERIRLMDSVMHRDLMQELRWTEHEVHSTRDGIDIETLDLPPPERAGIEVLADWGVLEEAVRVEGGHGTVRGPRAAVISASALVLLSVEGTTPSDFMQLGSALQRVWTRASLAGLGVQPLTPITFLLYRLTQAGGRDLQAVHRQELQEIRVAWHRLFPDAFPASFLFRLADIPPPSGRSLRRSLDEVLHHR